MIIPFHRAQIAEAWAKRNYKKHFISKLTDSDAEVNETEHWIDIAYDCGYLNKEDNQQLTATCREIGRLIGGMISKADTFCGQKESSTKEEDLSLNYPEH